MVVHEIVQAVESVGEVVEELLGDVYRVDERVVAEGQQGVRAAVVDGSIDRALLDVLGVDNEPSAWSGSGGAGNR